MAEWTCPDCGRTFGARGRSHRCEPGLSVDEFFADQPAHLRPIYEKIAAHLLEVADVIVEPVNVGIFFKGRRIFAELRPRRDRRGAVRFDLSVILFRRLMHSRVRRTTAWGESFVHHVDLYREQDVDEDVLQWLAESCLSFVQP